MTSKFFIFVLGYFVITQVASWHALIDAPDSSNSSNSTNFTIATAALRQTKFSIHRKRLPWNEARFECEKLLKRLAVLPKLEDAQILVNEIKSMSTPFSDEYDHAVKKYEYGMDRRYWIGLTDLAQEGDWIWMDDGEKLKYNFWYPSQPDHITKGALEHCVVLWNPGYHTGDSHTFNDENCMHKHYFICETWSKLNPSGTTSSIDSTTSTPPPTTTHSSETSSSTTTVKPP